MNSNIYTIEFRPLADVPYIPDELAIARFGEEYLFAMVPNWNGAGAIPLTSEVLHLANRLVCQYGSFETMTEVEPGKHGSISFVWKDTNNLAYLDVGPGDSVHLFYRLSDGRKWEGVGIATDPEFLRHIRIGLEFSKPQFLDAWIIFEVPAGGQFAGGWRGGIGAGAGTGFLAPAHP